MRTKFDRCRLTAITLSLCIPAFGLAQETEPDEQEQAEAEAGGRGCGGCGRRAVGARRAGRHRLPARRRRSQRKGLQLHGRGHRGARRLDPGGVLPHPALDVSLDHDPDQYEPALPGYGPGRRVHRTGAGHLHGQPSESGIGEYAGADERPTNSRHRRGRRLRQYPEHPLVGDRACGHPIGRRVGGIRLRRHRRCGELHYQEELHRPSPSTTGRSSAAPTRTRPRPA